MKRRAIQMIAGFAFAALLVVTTAVAVALWTPLGARIAIHQVLRIYDETAPGALEVEKISGRLASGVCLRGVSARSADGQVLLELDELCASWSLLPLLHRELVLHAVHLGKLRMTRIGREVTRLRELLPAQQADPKSDNVLPIAVSASLRVDEISGLVVNGRALPTVTDLSAVARAHGTRVDLARISLSCGPAALYAADVAIDVSETSGTAFLQLRRGSDLASLLFGKEMPSGLDVEATVELERKRLEAHAVVRDGFVEVGKGNVLGHLGQERKLIIDVHGCMESILHWAGLGSSIAPFEAHGVLSFDDEAWTARGRLICADCELSPLGRFRLEAEGEAFSDESVRGTLLLASQIAPVRGRGMIRAQCHGRRNGLSCSTDLDLQGLHVGRATVDRARLSAEVSLRDRIEILVRSAWAALDRGRYRLAGPARIVIAPDAIEVAGLTLRIWGGDVEAHGKWTVDEQGELTIAVSGIRLDDLSRMVPSLGMTGTLTHARARLFGSMLRPIARLDARFSGVSWKNVPVGKAQLRASFARDSFDARLEVTSDVRGHLLATAKLPVSWLPEQRRVVLELNRPVQARATLVGVDLSFLRDLGGLPRFSGILDVEAELSGVLRDLHGSMKLDAADIPLDALTERASGRARLEAALVAQHGAITGQAQIEIKRPTFDGESVGDVRVAVRLEENQVEIAVNGAAELAQKVAVRLTVPIDLRLSAVAPFAAIDRNRSATADLDIDGLDLGRWFGRKPALSRLHGLLSVRGSGELHGEAVRLAFEAKGDVRHPRLGSASLSAQLDVTGEEQFARVYLRHELGVTTKLEAWSGADLIAIMRKEASIEDVPFEASATLRQFDLALLAALLPTPLYDPRGSASGKIAVSGTVAHPSWSGRLALSEGQISIVPLQARFKNMEGVAVFQGDEVRLERLSVASGGGRAELTGSARFHGRRIASADGMLTLDHFPFVRPGLPKGEVDSSIRLAFDNALDTRRLRIDVGATRVDLAPGRERSPTAIPEGSAVRFVDLKDSREFAPLRTTTRSVPLDLRVTLIEPVRIRGPGIDMSWKGDLSLSDSTGQRQVGGKIEAQAGRFELLGNSFKLERGEISLPTSTVVDPYLDLLASAEADATRVEVHVKGRLSRPDITFASDPPLPQSRIVALLVTGKADTGEQSMSNEKVRAKAAGLLLAFNNQALEQRLGGKLRVDRIKVGLGERTDEPIVGVGKWLSRKLYVESVYHHNAPADENRATARVEYHFKPRWSVETYYGDANVGGLDIFLTRKFIEDTSDVGPRE